MPFAPYTRKPSSVNSVEDMGFEVDILMQSHLDVQCYPFLFVFRAL